MQSHLCTLVAHTNDPASDSQLRQEIPCHDLYRFEGCHKHDCSHCRFRWRGAVKLPLSTFFEVLYKFLDQPTIDAATRKSRGSFLVYLAFL